MHLSEIELQSFWNLLYEKILEPDEFIRITVINPKYTKIMFIKKLSELQDIIKKYGYICNIYANLSTTIGESGKEKDMYRRKTLFFDFDKKDFPEGFNHNSAVEQFKSLIINGKSLFFHCSVDSGGGYHLYIQTQITKDTELITDINKRLAEYMGADLKACSPTQIVRVPTSFNTKREKPKRVVTVVPYNPNKTIFYTFKKLNYILSTLDKDKIVLNVFNEALTDEQQNHKNKKEYDGTAVKYCCEKMFVEGVPQGHRNECHGRILNYLRDVKKFNRQDCYKQILEWNGRCDPPKDVKKVESEFNKFWEEHYNLLGCSPTNTHSKEILEHYCDKYKCIQISKGDIQGEIKRDIMLENEVFKPKCIKALRGNEYFILSVLKYESEGLSRKQLKGTISNKDGKPALSRKTLDNTLKNLIAMKFIKIIKGSKKENDFYMAVDLQNFNLGNVWTSWALCKLVIDNIITTQQFLVYILLCQAIQNGEKTTADKIATTLSVGLKKPMSSENISKMIRKLDKHKVLSIRKVPSAKGVIYYNYYTLRY